MNDIASALSPVVSFEKTTRKYSGEFDSPVEFLIVPAAEPHVIGYWSLTVTTIVSKEGTFVYYKVRIASLRTAHQCRSAFAEDYHSDTQYSRHGLNLLPVEIIDAITEATGENLRAAYDNQVVEAEAV